MQYKLVERMFIILPFMHSEDVNDCDTSVKLIQQNIEYAQSRNYNEDVISQLKGLKKSALSFLDMLMTYGRFPHRNMPLGRKNTPAEDDFFASSKIS